MRIKLVVIVLPLLALSLSSCHRRRVAGAPASRAGLVPRAPIERQLQPESGFVPAANAPIVRCDRNGWKKSGPPHPYEFTLPGAAYAPNTMFVGTVIGGQRQGPGAEYFEVQRAGPDRFRAERMHQANWVGGVRDGIEYEYRTGYLEVMVIWRGGVRDGELVVYDPCGNVIERHPMRNDQHDGPQTFFWANGRKKSEGTYRNGVMVGVFREWSEDGELYLEVAYSDAGAELSRTPYARGLKLTEQLGPTKVTRYRNGFRESEVTPADAQFLGTKRFWYQNGQPMLSIDVDARDRVVSSQRWHDDGRPMSAAEWDAKMRDEQFKQVAKGASKVLLLPLEILLYGLK